MIIFTNTKFYLVLTPCTPTIGFEFCLETFLGFLSDIFDEEFLVSVNTVDDDLANNGKGDSLDSAIIKQMQCIIKLNILN